MRMSVIVGVIGLGFASFSIRPAVGACPPMQTVFLFDQSGSMGDPGSTGQPKWQIARDKALNDFVNLPAGTLVAIAGFENAITGSSPFYKRVVNLADSKIKGIDDAFLLAKIMDTAADLGNLTPLAGAVCDGLLEIWTFAAPGNAPGAPSCVLSTKRDLYLYSDGLENSTPTSHVCYSTTSSGTPYDTSKVGSGFGLTAGSWERKIANMAYNGNPDFDFIDMPDFLRPVVNTTLLFDFVSFSAHDQPTPSEYDPDGKPRATLQSVGANGVAFFKGMSAVSFGSYFEAKLVNGAPTVIPVPGDTNPEPTRSCVDQADLNRIFEVFGRTVRNNDPQFSGAELASRDVTNDLVIDINDHALAIRNFGTCRASGPTQPPT